MRIANQTFTDGEILINILLTGAYPYSEEQIKKIEALGVRTFFVRNERDAIDADFSDVDAVVCNGPFLYHGIKAFSRLQYVQLTCAGLDRVPLAFIKENGIMLHNAGEVYSIPMAEWIVLKILEIYKHSAGFYRAQEKRAWNKDRSLLELYGKTACIVGAGSVGQEAAKRLQAFGVFVTAVDITQVKSPYIIKTYRPEEISLALEKSDITVLTLPLTEQTHHMLDKTRFSKMKKGSILVNVSRGAVVNEEDLAEALFCGQLSGAALDVFEEEPLPKESPLWSMEHVVITPHNSFISEKTSERLFDVIYENLRNYLLSKAGNKLCGKP